MAARAFVKVPWDRRVRTRRGRRRTPTDDEGPPHTLEQPLRQHRQVVVPAGVVAGSGRNVGTKNAYAATIAHRTAPTTRMSPERFARGRSARAALPRRRRRAQRDRGARVAHAHGVTGGRRSTVNCRPVRGQHEQATARRAR